MEELVNAYPFILVIVPDVGLMRRYTTLDALYALVER